MFKLADRAPLPCSAWAWLLAFAARGQEPSYPQRLAALHQQRTALLSADLPMDQCIDRARTILFKAIADDLLPAWYGTPWDFNGTTRVPGSGHIACGYFVTTVLLDAGFRVPRVRWAQLAAEPMIRKLAPDARRFVDAPVDEVEGWLVMQGDGLFAVGLDNHVGFIVHRQGHSRFVHSNYYHPRIGVMEEPLDGHSPFAASRVRVIGRLLNDAMVRAWLLGTDLSHPSLP